MNTHNTHGFSLIELMVVLVIVAIISMMAISSHQDSIIKSKRASAKTALLEILGAQEQFFINNKSYATTLSSLGYAADTHYLNQDGSAGTATSAVYELSLSSATTTSFTINAAPINGQANDTACATLSLSSTGLKSASGTGADENCW